MESMTSNLHWLQEFIFQKVKEGSSTRSEIKLFNKLDKMANHMDYMEPHKFSTLDKNFKESWWERESILVKKALAILDIPEESLIEFISNKKNGVYAKEILRLGLMIDQESQKDKKVSEL